MISYREAIARVLDLARPLSPIALPIDQALGLVAAEDVRAAGPIPPFTNSGMDGYAVRAADVARAGAAPVRLRVIADLPAGAVAAHDVGPGCASRIMTGAPLPPGADAVVPVESTEAVGEEVEIRGSVRAGANVRPAGEDIAAGALVIERGAALRPGDLGVLAEIGRVQIAVHPRARIAVITTGDELVDAAEEPGPGRIRDSNVHAVCAQAASFGAVPLPRARVPDRPEAVREAVREALAAADVVVTTGGISMGALDCVKDALDRLGAERLFWRVAQKPAGPLGCWRLGGKPIVGAPGNPVAAMIAMEEYVRPVLRRMMGHDRLFRPEREGRLETGWRRREGDGRLHFLRVLVREQDGALRASLSGPQGSGILSSMARANALALVPPEVDEVLAGGRVTLHLIEEVEDH